MNWRSWGAVQPFGRSFPWAPSPWPFACPSTPFPTAPPLTCPLTGAGAAEVVTAAASTGTGAGTDEGAGATGCGGSWVGRVSGVLGSDGRASAGVGAAGCGPACRVGSGGRPAAAWGRGPSTRWRAWRDRPWWRRLIGRTDERRRSGHRSRRRVVAVGGWASGSRIKGGGRSVRPSTDDTAGPSNGSPPAG